MNDKKKDEPRHVSLDQSLTDENTVLTISDKSLVMENRPFACPTDPDRPVTNPCTASSRNLVGETSEQSLIKEKQKESNLCPASSRNLVGETSEQSLIKEKRKESNLCPASSRNLAVETSDNSLVKEKESIPRPVSPRNVVVKINKNSLVKEKEKESIARPVSPRTVLVKINETSLTKEKQKESALCPVESRNVVAEISKRSVIQQRENESAQCSVEPKNIMGNKNARTNVIEEKSTPSINPVMSEQVAANMSREINKQTELIKCPSEFENLELKGSQQIDRLAEIENVVAKKSDKTFIENKKNRPVDRPLNTVRKQLNLKWTPFNTPAQEFLDPFVWTRFLTDIDCFALSSVATSDARAHQVVDLLRLEHLSGTKHCL